MALTVEKRLTPSKKWMVLSIFIALGASAIVSAILLKFTGADVGMAYAALFDGAFGDTRAIGKTLIKATPIILTGIAVTVAFRAKIWNIGAEGQLFAGALASYWAYLLLGPGAGVYILPLIFLAGFIGGGLYGGLAGFLRSRFRINEVLTTVMLNYVIIFFMSFMLVSGPWRDPSSHFAQTPRIDKSVWLPKIMDGSKLHIGFLIAVVCAIAVYVMLTRSSLGYEIRAVGHNPRASKFKGINVGKTAILAMCISGGLAGLAGVTEVFGVAYRLKGEISHGYGFTGIIVAVLAVLNPLAVIFVAVFFGAFAVGGVVMQVATGVPSVITSAIEAIILLFFLAAGTLTHFQIVWKDKT
jgi:simple sugar transport system permease protein